jgi:predicted  nucleic acid-binding Zn-ribbon protein
MTFDELINTLKSDNEKPETIYDDLTGLYTQASEKADSADAKISEMTETIKTLNDQITALKTKNYDLLTQVGESTKDDDVSRETSDEKPDDQKTIEELYGI